MTNHDMTGLISTVNKLVADVKALKLATPHNNASVSRGAFQVLSSEGLIVQGSERITGQWFLDGVGWVTGTLNIDGLLDIGGTLDVDGSATFNGDSRFVGTLDVEGPSTFSGTVDVTGDIKVIGNAVFDGDVSITKRLIVTAETFLRGKTTVEDDLEVVAGGKLKIGPIEFDPVSHNGYMRWLSGQEILAQSGALEMYSAGGIKYGIQLTTDGVKLPLVPPVANSDALDAMDWLAYERVGGKLWRVPNDIGSPLGGDFWWQFDPDGPQMTDDYGMRVHPITGETKMHNGIDFSGPDGTPIKAVARGTVVEIGTNPGAGFGYYVVLQHNGNIQSLYAHLNSPPPVSMGQVVAQKAVIGLMGTTGTSTGTHLHLELSLNGATVNPRSIITKPYVAE